MTPGPRFTTVSPSCRKAQDNPDLRQHSPPGGKSDPHLSERIGAQHITSHHGSLAKEARHKAEQRLKAGDLKALVATASLELGIDIGDVDLVCQLGSTRSIAAFLQRVGRSGHAAGHDQKGACFLQPGRAVECAGLIDASKRGELDRLVIPEQPLDVLAQQIVAMVGAEEWEESKLLP